MPDETPINRRSGKSS